VKVHAVANGSFFEKLGLRNGDVVTAMDGRRLTDPIAASVVFQRVAGSGNASIDVVRDGKPLTLPLAKDESVTAAGDSPVNEQPGMTAAERTALWSAAQDPTVASRYLERRRVVPPWQRELQVRFTTDLDEEG
jgi:hypothetical protein